MRKIKVYLPKNYEYISSADVYEKICVYMRYKLKIQYIDICDTVDIVAISKAIFTAIKAEKIYNVELTCFEIKQGNLIVTFY